MLKAGHVVGPKAAIELVRDAVSLVTDYIVEDDVLRFHDLCERSEEVRRFPRPGNAKFGPLHEFREQWQLPFIAEYSPDRMIEPDSTGVHENKAVVYPVGGAAHNPVVPINEAAVCEHLLPIDVRILMDLDVGF